MKRWLKARLREWSTLRGFIFIAGAVALYVVVIRAPQFAVQIAQGFQIIAGAMAAAGAVNIVKKDAPKPDGLP